MWDICLKLSHKPDNSANKQKLRHIDNSVLVTRGEGAWGEVEKGKWAKYPVEEGGLTLGGEHTVQYIRDVLYSCTLETHRMLSTNATPIHLIKLI